MASSPKSNNSVDYTGRLSLVASGVRRLNLLCVNAYYLESASGEVVLIDTGLGMALTRLHRLSPPPLAIVLTHGHCDHARGAEPLARALGVPVYAHPLELPYLSGRAEYPPEDLSTGGPVALFSRFFRNRSLNLGGCVQPLPEDGTIPHLPGWHWLHTPGHSPGHIALFRESDQILISGDAVLTTDVGSWASFFKRRPEIAGPPAPSTADWPSAMRSIRQLADLNPRIIGAGHGLPMTGPNVAAELHAFANRIESRMNSAEMRK